MTLLHFYLGCAVVGGVLLLLRTLMLLAGFGADSGDGGADFDPGTEVSDGDVSEGTPGADFRLFSMHGVTSFLFLFGLSGYLLGSREICSTPVAAAISVAIGFAAMWTIAKIFQVSRRLQTDGTVRLADAVGQNGTVYLAIRPGAAGKVQVTARGQLKVFDARAKDPAADIPTGTPVSVVSAEDVLVVEKRQ